MQSEAIKYQPPVEGVVVTQEEEQQILKLGRIMRKYDLIGGNHAIRSN